MISLFYLFNPIQNRTIMIKIPHMNDPQTNSLLNLFHHIHHEENEHKVHHCGGKHVLVDPTVDYSIHHCSCQKHSIDKQKATGHATDQYLNSLPIAIEFNELCPEGGWHIESGVQTKETKPLI